MLEVQLQKDMTENERMMFQSEYNSKKKDTTIAILLALFLGGLGGHRFYMNQPGIAVIYILFCWTFIPAVVALIECFFMKGRVEAYNDRLAQEIAVKIKMTR